MINDFSATVIAEILKKRDIPIQSFDIEMLDFLSKQKKPLTIKKISEKAKLEENTVKFIIKRLEKMRLCESNSPSYKLTEAGKSLVELCYKLNGEIQNSISKNDYASEISRMSKSIVG